MMVGMEHEGFPQRPAQQEAVDSNRTAEVDDLPNRLGFLETEELSHIRAQLVEATTSNNEEVVRELATECHQLAAEVVSRLQGDEYPKAQVGLMVAMALIWRDSGRNDDYLNDLQDALDCATNMGYNDIADTVRKALNAQL